MTEFPSFIAPPPPPPTHTHNRLYLKAYPFTFVLMMRVSCPSLNVIVRNTSRLWRLYFYFLWDYWALSGCLENRILLKFLLGAVSHMKRLNKTESPVFVLMCSLCFQKKPFYVSCKCALNTNILSLILLKKLTIR